MKADDDSWSDDEDSDGDDQDEPEERLRFYSICCRTTSDPSASFDSLAMALQHDRDNCGFDFLSVVPPSSDETFFEGAIVAVNKCRQFVPSCQEEGRMLGDKLKEFLSAKRDGQDLDERYFRPVLTDDSVLMCLDELEELKRRKEVDEGSATQGASNASDESSSMSGAKDMKSVAAIQQNDPRELQMKLSALEEQLSRARACIATLTKEDDDMDGKRSKPKRDNDTYYFSSYSHHCIHEVMLKDTVRTESYRDAILQNSGPLFKDKVVLDIGCGTGVLSIFAAKAGARKVIAVDNSDILKEARSIIDLNGYSDTITCVRGKIEELLLDDALPLDPKEQVDVIVSEWMGYALLFETMLPSVMKARDSVMKKAGGTMYPNGATIFLEGAFEARLDYWDDVYGINMAPMKERVARELTDEAGVEIVDASTIVTNRVCLTEFDLNTCLDDDLDFCVPFELSPNFKEDGDDAVVRINNLVVSFDIDFNVPGTKAVNFSTGCQNAPTHWKQTVLWFDPIYEVPTIKGGEAFRGKFKMGRNAKNHRDMDFHVHWEVGKVKGGAFVRTSNGTIRRSLCA